MSGASAETVGAAEARRRQLEALLRQRAQAADAQASPVDGPRDAPLSLGQERLHRMVAMDPGRPFYNVAVAYRLTGPLDTDAMRRAVAAIAARHEVLRTRFAEVDGAPVQRIAPEIDTDAIFRVSDLSASDGAAVTQAVSDEVGRVIDLANGPLWRLALFREGPETHVMTLVMHHIVSDGWTFELFLRDLAQGYAAAQAGTPAMADNEPAPQYAAFAERQRREAERASMAPLREAWARRLDGPIPPLALPEDRPGVGMADRSAASLPIAFDAERSEQVEALARSTGASAFMVLLTAFAATLHRATGQEDMLLLTPVTGRHRAHAREVYGYFNNILPLRLDLSGDPALETVGARVREVVLEAYRGQDVPFNWLAERPALRRVPLSRCLVSLDMEWPPRLALPGLEVAALAQETGTADFDLSLSVWHADGAFRGTLRYKSAVFDEDTVARIAESFETALRILVTEPATAVSQLPSPLAGRWEAAVETAGEGATGRLPRGPVEARLARDWADVFGRPQVGIDDSLAALGASSFAVAQLAERVREGFGVTLPLGDIFRAGTVAGMAEMIAAGAPEVRHGALAPIRPEGARAPVFLFEGVGIYFGLLPYLHPDQPVFGLVTEVSDGMPGVKEKAGAYAEEILAAVPDPAVPLHLGGISYGGLVALETAQRLKASGRTVGVLALLDTPGPGAYRRKGLAGRLSGYAWNTARFGLPYLRAMLGRLLARGRRRATKAGTSGQKPVGRHDLAEIMSVFMGKAGDYEISAYDGEILLVQMMERTAMNDALFDPALGHVDALLGWGEIARGGVVSVPVSGSHTGMMQEPHVAEIGKAMRTAIDRFEAG